MMSTSSPSTAPDGFPLEPARPLPADPEARNQLERLRGAARAYLTPAEVALIDRAASFAAARADQGRLRALLDSGTILAEMRIDVIGVITGLLHYVAIDRATSAPLSALTAEIASEFGPEVSYLIGSIAHFTTIEQRKGKRISKAPRASDLPGDRRDRERDDQAQRLQVETIRKMFVAMGDDPRIVIFKLAEHLQRQRERDAPPEERRLVAQEARDIYAPLAGRLGMSRIEAEMEDLAFAELDPDEFRHVSDLVAQARAEQHTYIERVCALLRQEAAKLDIPAEVSGRFKHLWSIYHKLVRNGWNIQQVYDLIAFRIIVPDVLQCYTMLGQVHALWQPQENRIKDFISHRKPNGYQSLHTTVFCLDNRLAEIQIRTREMHEEAEFGVAMHWYYKDVGDAAQVDKKLRGWLQQLRDWQGDLRQRTSVAEYLESGKEENGTRSQVFVFTPHGDVKDLPEGSTPVDFAYRIHTSLGDHCAGARITAGASMTKRLVPLDYVLKNGEIIEIITRKDAHPTRDWLKFIRTAAARSHINRYLKQHERAIYIAVGQERFDREARLAGIGSLENISEELLRLVAEKLQYATVEDMLAAIGGDALRSSTVIQELTALVEPLLPPETDLEPAVNAPLPGTEAVLTLAGVGGLLARLANCCHPLPGDAITGYISRGRGIVIHHARCRALRRLREREGERIVQVAWNQMRMDHYDAAVIISARDRTGLLRDVTQQIHELKLNMGTVSTTTSRKLIATLALTLQIQNVEQLEEALKRIRAIKDVEDAQRDTRARAAD